MWGRAGRGTQRYRKPRAARNRIRGQSTGGRRGWGTPRGVTEGYLSQRAFFCQHEELGFYPPVPVEGAGVGEELGHRMRPQERGGGIRVTEDRDGREQRALCISRGVSAGSAASLLLAGD